MIKYEIETFEWGCEIIEITSDEEVIVIPEKIEGLEVLKLGDNCLLGNPKIKELKMPNTVLFIEFEAMCDCFNLLYIEFSENLLYVENRAVHNTAFYEDQDNWLYSESIGVKSLYLADNRILYEVICYDEQDLSSITYGILPQTIMIGEYAFCTPIASRLESVLLPEVKYIGNCAFCECSFINSITFPKSLEKIGISAFENTNIAEANFKNCKSLQKIEANSFLNVPVEKLVLPGYCEVSEDAFNYPDLKLFIGDDEYILPDLSELSIIAKGE
jgi:hypothetical protein